MNDIKQETTLDNFIKGKGQHDPGYFIEIFNKDYEQTKFKFRFFISSKQINLTIDGGRPAHHIVQDLIKFECKNGKKFLNIITELKKQNNLSFCIYKSKYEGNLFLNNIDLVSITDCLGLDDISFGFRTLIKISPMIFKFGTNDEIKRFWDKMCKNYNTVKQMLSKDKEPPKTGYPDCRGYLSRLKQIVNLTDVEISHADDLGKMGFSD